MQQHSLSRSSQYCSTLLVARMKDDTSLIWLNFKFFRKLMTVALLLISISHDGRPGKIVVTTLWIVNLNLIFTHKTLVDRGCCWCWEHHHSGTYAFFDLPLGIVDCRIFSQPMPTVCCTNVHTNGVPSALVNHDAINRELSLLIIDIIRHALMIRMKKFDCQTHH